MFSETTMSAVRRANEANVPLDDATAFDIASELKLGVWRIGVVVPVELTEFLTMGAFEQSAFQTMLADVSADLGVSEVDRVVTSLSRYTEFHGKRGPVTPWPPKK